MTSERTILIEPVAPVVYLNKRPYCNWFPLVVMLLFLIAACGFLVQVKAISQLKTEVAELKSEVAALKEEDLHLWDEAWRHATSTGYAAYYEGWTKQYECEHRTPKQYRDRVIRLRAENKNQLCR